MSYDLFLWRWRDGRHMAPAACYLLMLDGVECPDATELDAAALGAELRGFLDPSSVIETTPRGITLECGWRNRELIRQQVTEFARRHDLVVFDPQRETMTESDRRLAAAIAEAAGREARQDSGDRFEELSAAARAGDGHAWLELGNRHFFGEGIPRNLNEAFRCYLKSAESGDDSGMVNVASCYRKGEGTGKDSSRAIAWYQAAMATDTTFAPFELAAMYEAGEGVPRDTTRAVELLRIAEAGGHPDARTELRRLGAR